MVVIRAWCSNSSHQNPWPSWLPKAASQHNPDHPSPPHQSQWWAVSAAPHRFLAVHFIRNRAINCTTTTSKASIHKAAKSAADKEGTCPNNRSNSGRSRINSTPTTTTKDMAIKVVGITMVVWVVKEAVGTINSTVLVVVAVTMAAAINKDKTISIQAVAPTAMLIITSNSHNLNGSKNIKISQHHSNPKSQMLLQQPQPTLSKQWTSHKWLKWLSRKALQ